MSTERIAHATTFLGGGLVRGRHRGGGGAKHERCLEEVVTTKSTLLLKNKKHIIRRTCLDGKGWRIKKYARDVHLLCPVRDQSLNAKGSSTRTR